MSLEIKSVTPRYDDSLLIYGAGKNLYRYLEYTPREYRNKIAGIIDKDDSLWGNMVEGYEISSPGSIGDMTFDKVWISIGDPIVAERVREEVFKPWLTIQKEIEFLDPYRLHFRYKNWCENIYPQRIFDCFPFYNELELLELRLELLDDYVDFFVLVEMTRNHNGKEKPLFFKENRQLFERFNDKIIHIVIYDVDIPKMGGIIRDGKDWTLENFQRNSLVKGMSTCNDNDIIIISDIDEIPDYRILEKIKFGNDSEISNDISRGPICFVNTMYQGYLNCKSHELWLGGVALNYCHLMSPQICRDWRSTFPKIKCGWHFSWMGGKTRIFEKAMSIVESPQDGEIIKKMIENYKSKKGVALNSDASLINIDDEDIPFIDKLKERVPHWFAT